MSDVPVMNIVSAMNTSNRTGRRMPSPISKTIMQGLGLVILVGWGASVAKGQTQQGIGDWAKPPTGTLRHPEGLETILKRADLKELARDIERRGDPKRGALLFHRSAAGCRNCHGEGVGATPLGPDLTRGGETQTPEYIVESILFPSRVIRKGYETLAVVKDDGQAISGMVVKQDDREVVLRDAADLEKEIRISRDEIEAIRPLPTSLMPEGLIGAIGGQKPF
jgi:putative heme-binding domain-containing protein